MTLDNKIKIDDGSQVIKEISNTIKNGDIIILDTGMLIPRIFDVENNRFMKIPEFIRILDGSYDFIKEVGNSFKKYYENLYYLCSLYNPILIEEVKQEIEPLYDILTSINRNMKRGVKQLSFKKDRIHGYPYNNCGIFSIKKRINCFNEIRRFTKQIRKNISSLTERFVNKIVDEDFSNIYKSVEDIVRDMHNVNEISLTDKAIVSYALYYSLKDKSKPLILSGDRHIKNIIAKLNVYKNLNNILASARAMVIYVGKNYIEKAEM